MSWSVTVTDDQRSLLVEQRTQGSGRVWFERATGRRGEMIELAARLNELEGRRKRDPSAEPPPEHTHEFTQDLTLISDLGRAVVFRCACDHQVTIPATVVAHASMR